MQQAGSTAMQRMWVQGHSEVGTSQRQHVVSSPRVLAVKAIMSSLRVVTVEAIMSLPHVVTVEAITQHLDE